MWGLYYVYENDNLQNIFQMMILFYEKCTFLYFFVMSLTFYDD